MTAPATISELNEAAKRLADTAGPPPSVLAALNAVMRDVQAVRKNDRNESQNFNFRGIDAVVNAVGPAFREHGIVVLPIAEEATYDTFNTRGGTLMHACTLKVRFRFYGPAGDFVEAVAYGESADAGDKSTPKSHSVAFRTALLQVLTIPTDEPDPDSTSYERTVPTPPPPPPKPFDLNKFLDGCEKQGLDPMDVLAFAEIDKPLDQLADEDRPALLAASFALTKAASEEAKEEGP